MPVAGITPIEIVGSRSMNVSIENPSIELMFTFAGNAAFDDAVLRLAIEAELPPTWNIVSTIFGTRTLVLQSYNARQRSEGGPYYDGTATYGLAQPRKTGQVWFSFDGTGGTAHIQHSLATTKFGEQLGGTPAQDFKNAINVNNDTVEGTEKTVPLFKFRLDYYPATDLMTPAYIMDIYELQAKPVNENEVSLGGIIFEPGELLFLGPTGQPRGFDDWELGFHFLGSPNLTGQTIGDIEDVEKKGHEYLWIRFKDTVSNYTGIKVPEFVYVEKIYDLGNFSNLGIDGIPIQGLAGQ